MFQLWRYISYQEIDKQNPTKELFPIIFANQVGAALAIMMLLFGIIHLVFGDYSISLIRFLLAGLFMFTVLLNKRNKTHISRHILLISIGLLTISTIFVSGLNGNYRVTILLVLLCATLIMDRTVHYISYTLFCIALFYGCSRIAFYAPLLIAPENQIIFRYISTGIIVGLVFFFVFILKKEITDTRQRVREKQRNLEKSRKKIQAQNQVLQEAYNDIHSRQKEFKTILETIPVAIALISEKGIFLENNQNFSDLYELGNEPIVGKSFKIMPRHLTANIDWTNINRAFNGELVEYDKVLDKGNGNLISLHCTVLPIEPSIYGVKGCYFFLENRTEIKEKERALLRSNAKLISEVEKSKRLEKEQSYALSLLETTLESTPYGIWVTNNKGETERFNQQFIKLWGINSALAASDDILLRDAILGQVREPEVFKNKLREIQLHPNQKSRDLLTLSDGRVVERFSRPHLHRNNVIGRVWTFLDITAQKNIETKLVTANQELQQFASVASHDMKEPLRTISSFSTLLSRRIPDQPDAQEYLHFIKDAASRMTHLLEDLINYARADRSQESHKKISLERILLLVQNNLHSTIQQNNVQIKSVPLPIVMGQSTPFIQLFQNLIANAVKFQKADNQPVINIELDEIGDYWQIGIRDNGIGMAPEYLERIFQPFTRLHSHSEYKGSGIGLATCTKIVEHYGGRIWVESELGIGTVFYFTLPKIAESEAILTTTALPLRVPLRN